MSPTRWASPPKGGHGSDPPAVQPAGPVGQIVLDVAGGQHGPGLLGPGPLPEPPGDAALAVAKFSLAFDGLFVFTGTHSKCLLA